MQIQGPFNVGVITDEVTGGRELHLEFSREFRALDEDARSEAFIAYIAALRQGIAAAIEDSREQQGMETMLRIAEELLPHIEADEIPLGETIVIQVQTSNLLQAFLQ